MNEWQHMCGLSNLSIWWQGYFWNIFRLILDFSQFFCFSQYIYSMFRHLLYVYKTHIHTKCLLGCVSINPVVHRVISVDMILHYLSKIQLFFCIFFFFLSNGTAFSGHIYHGLHLHLVLEAFLSVQSQVDNFCVLLLKTFCDCPLWTIYRVSRKWIQLVCFDRVNIHLIKNI